MHLVILFFTSFSLARAQTKLPNETQPVETQPVYFSLIISRGENGYNSSGAIPAIHIALEEIERHQLLPGYNLTYVTARNSKVYVSTQY